MRQVSFLVCFTAAILAQEGPINLSLQESGPEGIPKGWFAIQRSGYSTAVSQDCRTPKSHCVVLRYDGSTDPSDFGWVLQTFDAAALRGRQLRYRAWLRVNDPSVARAQLFVRVDRPNREIGFHDYSHDRPVRSRDWVMREISGRIDTDAVKIAIGLMLGGRGSASFTDLEFETVESQR